MFPLANKVHFFPDEFAGLCGWPSTLAPLFLCASNRLLFRHGDLHQWFTASIWQRARPLY